MNLFIVFKKKIKIKKRVAFIPTLQECYFDENLSCNLFMHMLFFVFFFFNNWVVRALFQTPQTIEKPKKKKSSAKQLTPTSPFGRKSQANEQ